MTWCPSCRAEYRPGFDTCADCHVPLVDTEPPPPREEASEPGFPAVELHRYTHRFEADVITARLLDAGLRAVTLGDDVGGWYPHLGASAGYRVMVAEDELDAAQRILESGSSGRRRRRPRST
jgi:hypothetical protein